MCSSRYLQISLIDMFSFFQVEQQVTLMSIPETQQQQGADAEALQQDDYLSQVAYIYRCTESSKLSKQVSL
jgi:hypothetical protein